MQQIQIVGHLGQDCKVIDHNGRKFVSFSVAVNDDYKDQAGAKVDRVVWYDCAMDSTAVSQYLKKGTQVFIQGKPRIELYQDREQRWNGKIKVAVGRLQLLGSAQAPAGNDLPPEAPKSATSAATTPASASTSGEGDNDLPF